MSQKMDDLISRKALEKAISKACGWREDDKVVLLDAIDNAPSVAAEPVPVTGETSDGHHTFNELYHHRAVLFSVICNDRPELAWKSRKHHDGTMYDGMFIVGIQTPDGQATYHYDVEPYWDMFKVVELPQAPEWDGHTPDEAIRRIGNLAAEPVRHARWEERTFFNGCTPDRDLFCSCCNHDNGWSLWKHCPYCGARMDAKEDEHG